jgi:predicted nuclease of predicted toxin-antitoxin system
MKLLIDMNLSPKWVEELKQGGWDAVHWSAMSDSCATDSTIMEWARTNGYVVFTHDLDFGALLATTRVQGPSVIQVRTQDVMPQSIGNRMVQILRQHQPVLEKGALVTVDETKSRVRILPFP